MLLFGLLIRWFEYGWIGLDYVGFVGYFGGGGVVVFFVGWRFFVL